VNARNLVQAAANAEMHLRRAYVRERVRVVRRELARETEAEIRAAIAEQFMMTARDASKGAQ